MPVFNDQRELIGLSVGDINNLQVEFRRLIVEDGFDVSEILKCLTLNPAKRLKIQNQKRQVAVGADADLIVFRQDWQIDQVYAKGRKMVDAGQVLVKGTFE